MNIQLKTKSFIHLFENNLTRVGWVCKFNSTNPIQQDSLQKIKKFWEKERLHDAGLDYESLTDEEKIIHDLHQDAITKGHFTYYDPKTNERILTRLRHYLRGKCCGNACRHCVYNHDNVIDEYKLKVRRFNTSFWSYPDGVLDSRPKVDESCYFDGSNLRQKRGHRSTSMTFNFNKT